jgi:hypothetical protein
MFYGFVMWIVFIWLMWYYTERRKLVPEHGYVKVIGACFAMALLWPATLLVWLTWSVFEVIN